MEITTLSNLKYSICRMVTKGTIDEKIVLRAAAKRKIEKLVIHK